MMGKNLMWVARQHGHSVQVMLSMYGAWIEGSTEEDIEAIKRSMQAAAMGVEIHGAEPPAAPISPHGGATKVPLDRGWGA
jgi:hypothetical protein